MTHEELQKLKDDGKIAYDFNVFGGIYAYKRMKFYLMKIMYLKCIILLFKTGKE